MPKGTPQSSLPVVEEPFIARNLFSHHFLKERLPREDPRWRRDEARNLETFNHVKNLYQRIRPAEKEQYRRNEANLEKDLIRPILESLGHCYDVQESIHFTYRGPERPDYTLFPSEAVRRAAKGESNKYLTAVIALAEAKAWDLELDKTAKVGPARYANPSLQINNYLRDTNITWGILTNGRKWRLYNKETSLHLDSYYEVDLVQLIEAGSSEDFKYFYLFFRREAFVSEASVPSFLDDIFAGSIRYAKELEEDVKENIYDALRFLIKGFLEHPDNQLKASDLETIHENSLILLYRLLFVLYAEAKGLLPYRNALYRDMSLERLREDVRTDLDKPVPTLTAAGYSFWARLSDLFRLVNEGSEARRIPREHLFIPPYNGGLFDPIKHPFLETAKVGDKYLSQAIHLLSWSGGRNGRQAGFVDYTTLSVRHLGSIYEGLLEYKPMIAEEDMIVVKEKGREVFKTVSEVHLNAKQLRKLNRVSGGDVYLRTDRGERKATGSYYTPDYIVKYIVETTLAPLLDEIRGRGLKGIDFVRDVLSLNVLDPAMGSGHFLVEATSFLAAKIVESLEETGGGAEPAAEADVLWARREVARRCIYGVDLNPLAVELAKVSLWLHTVTKDKPLSFLDHHLKCGNSLIGARLVNLPWYPKPETRRSTSRTQKVDLEGPKPFIGKLLEVVRRLELTPDETLQQVKEKEQMFKELKETPEYLKIKALCDVRTSISFGNTIEERPYQDFVNHVFYGSQHDWLEDRERSWFKRANLISADRRFFHWELEFPEVFSGGNRPGFDAVIGNPPYVSFGLGRVGKLDASEADYFRTEFAYSAEYKISTYAVFMELAIQLSCERGRQGLILPDSFLVGRYFSKVRGLLLDNTVVALVHFSEDFWESGDVGFPVIWIGEKGVPQTDSSQFSLVFAPSLEDFVAGKSVERKLDRMLPLSNRRKRIRLIKDAATALTVDRIESVEAIVSDLLSMHHGVRSKVGRARVVRKSTAGGDPRWKRGLVESNQVTRFGIDYRGDYILIDPTLLFSGGWRLEEIETPKILLRRTGDSIIAALDRDGYYHTNALIYGNALRGEALQTLAYLCGILNSRLFTYYYRAVTAKEGRTFPQVEIDSLEELCVPELRAETVFSREELRRWKNSIVELIERGQKREVCALINSALSEASCPSHELLVFIVNEAENHWARYQEVANEFLYWLRAAASSDFDDWVGKTTIHDFASQPLQSLVEVFKVNEKKSELQPHRRSEDLHMLRQNHDRAVSRIRPILDTLELIDLLLDLVVYRLYGLAETDVAVVEGLSEIGVREKYGWSH